MADDHREIAVVSDPLSKIRGRGDVLLIAGDLLAIRLCLSLGPRREFGSDKRE